MDFPRSGVGLVGLAVLVGVTLLGLLALILLNVVATRSIRKEGYEKYGRFEAGNPPIDVVRKKLIMQYFGFVFLIVVLECALLYLAVLAVGGLSLSFVSLLIIVAVVYVLTILFLYKHIADLREWT